MNFLINRRDGEAQSVLYLASWRLRGEKISLNTETGGTERARLSLYSPFSCFVQWNSHKYQNNNAKVLFTSTMRYQNH